MQPASCILILAGVYAAYSKWINIEVELAQSMNKKIIAIEPRGASKIPPLGRILQLLAQS